MNLRSIITSCAIGIVIGFFTCHGCSSSQNSESSLTTQRVYDSLSAVASNMSEKATEARSIAVILEKKVEKMEMEKDELARRYAASKPSGRKKIQTMCPDSKESLMAYDDLAAKCDSLIDNSNHIIDSLHASIDNLKLALAYQDTVIVIADKKFDLKKQDVKALKRSKIRTILKTIFTVIAVEAAAAAATIGIIYFKK